MTNIRRIRNMDEVAFRSYRMGLLDTLEWLRRNPEALNDDEAFQKFYEQGSRIWRATVGNYAASREEAQGGREAILSL